MGKGIFIDDTTDEEPESTEPVVDSPAVTSSLHDNLEDELTEEEQKEVDEKNKAEDVERAIYTDNNFWNNTSSQDEEYDIDALLEELE